MDEYCSPTWFIESAHPAVVAFARDAAGDGDATARAVRLYYAVRDGIAYNPYRYTFERGPYRASAVLAAREGFCVQKSILLAAAARAIGIPCRVGYANVINHLSTKRMRELLRTDLFVFHGYNEFHLGGRWVKATPAFDAALCQRFGLRPLEFTGAEDSIFHPYDLAGRRHMEYVHDYGTFADFPFETMVRESLRHYPHIEALMREHDAGARIEDPELAGTPDPSPRSPE
ncbi:MAG TPA: transglutaminase family protein [Spirochaetota bacterium]|nr:transglutaminase family protein [Spirochaetota bacterium]